MLCIHLTWWLQSQLLIRLVWGCFLSSLGAGLSAQWGRISPLSIAQAELSFWAEPVPSSLPLPHCQRDLGEQKDDSGIFFSQFPACCLKKKILSYCRKGCDAEKLQKCLILSMRKDRAGWEGRGRGEIPIACGEWEPRQADWGGENGKQGGCGSCWSLERSEEGSVGMEVLGWQEPIWKWLGGGGAGGIPAGAPRTSHASAGSFSNRTRGRNFPGAWLPAGCGRWCCIAICSGGGREQKGLFPCAISRKEKKGICVFLCQSLQLSVITAKPRGTAEDVMGNNYYSQFFSRLL